MYSIGIEIGWDSWRLVEVKRTFAGARVVRHSEFSGSLGERASGISNYISEHRLSNARLGIVLPREISIIRTVDIPSPSLDALSGIIRFEMEKYLPLAPSGYYYGYKVAGRKGNIYSVILGASTKKNIDEAKDAFSSSGIKTSFVCLWHEAVVNALSHLGRTKEQNNVLLIGDNGMKITLDAFVGSLPVYSKNIDVNETGPAEAIKCELGRVETLTSRKVEDFRVICPGDHGCGISSADEGSISKPGQNSRLEPTYWAAFGGSLAAAGLCNKSICLSPLDGDRKENKFLVSAVLSVFFIFLLGIFGASFAVKDMLTLRYLDRSISELKNGKNKNGAAGVNDQAVGKTGVLEAISPPTDILDLLKELTEIMPDDASLTALEYRRGSVVLEGVSANASSLLIVLADSKLMKDFEFVAPVVRVSPEKEKFRIKARIKDEQVVGI